MKRAMTIAGPLSPLLHARQPNQGEYWTDPNTGEMIEIPKSRPVHLMLEDTNG
jgi:hypothetical protein